MSVLNWNVESALLGGTIYNAILSDDTDMIVIEDVWSGNYSTPIIESSDGGATWGGASGINTAFRGQAAAHDGAGTFVVVGNGLGGSTLMYRRDSGGTWGTSTLPSFTSIWFGVAWNGNTFCAVRENQAATSATGSGWTGRVLTIGSTPRIVAQGTDFIAVSQGDDKARVSTDDGVNWNTYNMPSSGWSDIATNGSRLVAVGSDKIAYSDDVGQTWTEVAVSGSWTNVRWNGNIFCAIAAGNGDVATSDSGIAWVPDTAPDFMSPGMTVHGGNFAVLGSDGDVLFSEPGFVEFWTDEVNAQELDAL